MSYVSHAPCKNYFFDITFKCAQGTKNLLGYFQNVQANYLKLKLIVNSIN